MRKRPSEGLGGEKRAAKTSQQPIARWSHGVQDQRQVDESTIRNQAVCDPRRDQDGRGELLAGLAKGKENQFRVKTTTKKDALHVHRKTKEKELHRREQA